jgi:hypothetical protein
MTEDGENKTRIGIPKVLMLKEKERKNYTRSQEPEE